MHNEDILLGDIGVVPTTTGRTDPTTPGGYDGSGVNPDRKIVEVIEEEEKPKNNWIMYLGVGIMAYILLFKNK